MCHFCWHYLCHSHPEKLNSMHATREHPHNLWQWRSSLTEGQPVACANNYVSTGQPSSLLLFLKVPSVVHRSPPFEGAPMGFNGDGLLQIWQNPENWDLRYVHIAVCHFKITRPIVHCPWFSYLPWAMETKVGKLAGKCVWKLAWLDLFSNDSHVNELWIQLACFQNLVPFYCTEGWITNCRSWIMRYICLPKASFRSATLSESTTLAGYNSFKWI